MFLPMAVDMPAKNAPAVLVPMARPASRAFVLVQFVLLLIVVVVVLREVATVKVAPRALRLIVPAVRARAVADAQP